MELLYLKSLNATSIDDKESHLEITVQPKKHHTSCIHCGSDRAHVHDKTWQDFFDTPMHGKPVVLKINRFRYKCVDCCRTYREWLPDMDKKRFMTTRLKGYIQNKVMRNTFAVVARETGLDEKTIRHVFDDYAQKQKEKMPIETPSILGIDELKLIGDYRCILTNIEQNTVFDMLPSRKKVDVIEYFENIPNKSNIKVVVMDMWKPYKDAVYQKLPGRLIVIDKFHVVRMASESLEYARKKIRRELSIKDRLKLKSARYTLLKRKHSLNENECETLNQYITLFPILGEIYKAKEIFFEIFDSDIYSEKARSLLTRWKDGLSPDAQLCFKPLLTALNNWFEEILNGFDIKVTNAYTESINRLAKQIQYVGRGYSFDVVRVKMMYDEKANKPSVKPIRSKNRKPPVDNFTLGKMLPSQFEQNVNNSERVYYGPHIPTLCKLLERGHFD